MELKGLIEEDFINYKKPSMFLSFGRCNFKCDKECGRRVCQNRALVKEKDIEIGIKTIVNRYINNPITSAIVCGGLEPFDSWEDLLQLISYLRAQTNDDIVIYTGYTEGEVQDKVEQIWDIGNLIIKFGRYIPNDEGYFNEELGVKLASRNQYVVRYRNAYKNQSR